MDTWQELIECRKVKKMSEYDNDYQTIEKELKKQNVAYSSALFRAIANIKNYDEILMEKNKQIIKLQKTNVDMMDKYEILIKRIEKRQERTETPQDHVETRNDTVEIRHHDKPILPLRLFNRPFVWSWIILNPLTFSFVAFALGIEGNDTMINFCGLWSIAWLCYGFVLGIKNRGKLRDMKKLATT